MANTSRKRPPPPANGTSAGRPPPSSAGGAAGAAKAGAGGGAPALAGIDTLLAKYARHLPPGASISVQLIKGPSTSSVDPIAARKAAAKSAKAAAKAGRGLLDSGMSGMSSGNDSDYNTANGGANYGAGRGLSAPLAFPRLAKFPETVTAPDFTRRLGDGRMYEEEVPKAKVCLVYNLMFSCCLLMYVCLVFSGVVFTRCMRGQWH